MGNPDRKEADEIYAAAMDAAVHVMELTRVMRRNVAKRIAEPIIRTSNSVSNNFLLAWQNRDNAEQFRSKLSAAIRDATDTRNRLDAAATANQMPVERTRKVVQIYDALIKRLQALQAT